MNAHKGVIQRKRTKYNKLYCCGKRTEKRKGSFKYCTSCFDL